FQFRPTEANGGVFNVSVTATNDLGLSVTASFKLTVVVNTAPSIGAIAAVSIAEGNTQTVNVSVTDPDRATLNQINTLSLSGAPGFAILSDNGNGTGTINLSPKTGDAGSYTITVRALDNGVPAKTGEVTFTVTVTSTVKIIAASFNKKQLFVSGENFGPNPTLIVNGVTVPANFIVPSPSPNSITAKADNKKKLGLRKGTNSIEVIGINGVKAAVYTLPL
ncbi:MAG TPA: cadherin domain-containing protein, partial [Acidobacteriota bacterium]|nr:cadherin domain-containing protein [Acidobacteriota bacterium]